MTVLMFKCFPPTSGRSRALQGAAVLPVALLEPCQEAFWKWGC